MEVGITFDLKEEYRRLGYCGEEIAEFDTEETINGIENALNELGFTTERIGTVKSLVNRLSQGITWDIVFNIAEGMYGFGRESQVPALLDAYRIPYTFSDPLVLSLTLHKGMAKHVVRDFSLETPDFKVIRKMDDIEKLHIPFPVFAKPVAEGTGKGVSGKSIIRDVDQLTEVISDLLHRFKQPVLVEEFLPGREFTVGLLGTGRNAKVAGVVEVVNNQNVDELVYGYEVKSDFRTKVKYEVPEKEMIKRCSRLALAAWRGLECRDGGRIDVRFNLKGRPSFIEVNPLAGLTPNVSDLPILCELNGISYKKMIYEIMASALKRVRSKKVKNELRKWQQENLNGEEI